jgi:hypothetical protein
MEYDVNELRKYIGFLAPEADFDSEFRFYYDETNNIRKFYVQENDFNSSFDLNFVLAGIVVENNIPDFTTFLDSLKLQSNIKEIKFKHIAKGTLTECLKSKKLSSFFKLLAESDLYIHYSIINIFYYSIVDIVDSAISNSPAALKAGLQFAMNLKNDLYKLSKFEKESVIELFYSYQYPNIKKESILGFVRDLTGLFQKYENTQEFHFGLTSLKQILNESEKIESLPFIMNETDYILLKDFSQFYLRPLYTFKNSKHFFDREDQIEPIIDSFKLVDKGTIFKPYRFIDSKEDMLIQLSDILTGFIGKFSEFINTHSKKEIMVIVKTLDDIQKRNLCLYLNILEKSNNKNVGFFHHVTSIDYLNKVRFLNEQMGEICA